MKRGRFIRLFGSALGSYDPETIAHITRVQADGGVVDSPALCNTYFIYKAANSFMADVIIDAIPHVLGYKEGATPLKCSKIYGSAADGSGDIIQTNASYQPLLLTYAGEKYVYLPDLTGGNITTNGINGYANYLQIEAKLDITNLSNGLSTYSGIAAQRTNVDTGVFSLYYDNTGLLYQLYYYVDSVLGLQRIIDTSTAPITGTEKYLRSTTQLNPTSIRTIFESSMDGVSWTQVGATITNSGIAPISFNNEPTTKLSIGSTSEGAASGISAKVYYCKIRQSAGVDTVVFDFKNYNAAVSETIWTSSTGETWTLTGGKLNTTYHAVIVTRTNIQLKDSNSIKSAVNPLPDNGITQIHVGSILAAPYSDGGNIYRGALMQTSNNYYRNQLIFMGAEEVDLIRGQGFTNTAPAIYHGVDVLSYRNQIISERLKLNTIVKAYKNNTLLTTLAIDYGIYPYDITIVGGYGALSVAQSFGGCLSINSILSESNLYALHDFINSELFNNELY